MSHEPIDPRDDEAATPKCLNDCGETARFGSKYCCPNCEYGFKTKQARLLYADKTRVL